METIDIINKKDVIRVTDSSDLPKFIEWNVDMNVNVPSSVGSKLLLRLRWIAVSVGIVAIAILFWQIKSEIDEMRLQIHDTNRQLKTLQWEHEKLNLQYVRVFSTMERVQSNCERLQKSAASAHLITGMVSYLQRQSKVNDRREKEIKNDITNTDKERATRARRSLTYETPKRNLTTIARLETIVQGDELDTYRSTRMRRDEGRGKKRTKMKRRPKRSCGRLVPLTATFLGAVPEQHVIDSAHIGPWVKSIKNESKYSFNKFHLVDDRKAIEVTVDGLYMISAQIYYFGDFTHHSYWILLNAEGASATQKLVKCAAVSAISDREVSCYTSIVLTLNKGDRIYVQQQERGRLINLREGYSYIQFVLLSSDVKRRY